MVTSLGYEHENYVVLPDKGITIRFFTRYQVGYIFPECMATVIKFWNRVVLVTSLDSF